MARVFNNGICRCCSSEGTFKDVTSKYHWMGQEEVYSSMLKECFDISIHLDDFQNSGICEVCITQLRNASNFKKQVLHTEQQFLQAIGNNKSFQSEEEIKIEIPKSEEDTEELADIYADGDDVEDPDFIPELKEEKEELKPKKRNIKATPCSSKAKKPKAETKASAKRNGAKIIKKALMADRRPPRRKLINVQPKDEVKLVVVRRNESDKHQENIRIILECSNATPIRTRRGVGYACCFCEDQYPDPADLKQHTMNNHDTDTKSEFMKGRPMRNFIVKLDITFLKCTLCGSSIKDLDKFMEHLKSVHGKPINTNIKNYIVPFRFDCDLLRCVICSNDFSNFKVLLEHMNVHFRNHVCEICGSGFVNKTILQAHGYRHITGVFNCVHCPKVFNTRVKQKDHERAVHKCLNRRNKCGYCGEKFNDYTKKYDHEIKMHGTKPLVLTCQACSKTFGNQRALTGHIKTYHLLEKRRAK